MLNREAGEIDYNSAIPYFTTDEQDEITELQQNIANVFNSEIDSYINGQKSLDDWDGLVTMLEQQGTERLEELYNAAYERAK